MWCEWIHIHVKNHEKWANSVSLSTPQSFRLQRSKMEWRRPLWITRMRCLPHINLILSSRTNCTPERPEVITIRARNCNIATAIEVQSRWLWLLISHRTANIIKSNESLTLCSTCTSGAAQAGQFPTDDPLGNKTRLNHRVDGWMKERVEWSY